MRKPRAAAAVAVTAAFLTQSCFTLSRYAVPEPHEREALAVHGVVLGEGPDADVVRFSEIGEARWTETALVITGVLDAPGEPGHGEVSTVTFPVADVSQVLVREVDATRMSIGIGGVLMAVSVAIAFIVTGKSQDGVPIGS